VRVIWAHCLCFVNRHPAGWNRCAGWLSPGSENDHGSPSDCFQISACMTLESGAEGGTFGSTPSAHAAIRVTRSMVVHANVEETAPCSRPFRDGPRSAAGERAIAAAACGDEWGVGRNGRRVRL
jgi:hypothetical protein